MEKRFDEWMDLKADLHKKIKIPPQVNRGDIWWASIGENIGSEINGKNRNFTRPVIIFKKLSRESLFVIPVTKVLKNGSWYIHFQQKNIDMNACLQQVRVIDIRRLWSRMGELDRNDFEKIKLEFTKLYLKKIFSLQSST